MANAIAFVTVPMAVLMLVISLELPDEHSNNRNILLFEKVEYQILNESTFSYHLVEFRSIAYNVIRFNVTFTLTKPINRVWLHFVLYRKYMRYQKYLINLWEDACTFFDGSKISPMTKVIFWNLQRLGAQVKYKCPFSNELMIAHSGLNISQFITFTVPSARYRLDITVSSENKSNNNGGGLVTFQIYFSVSDHRVLFDWNCINFKEICK